MLGQYLKKYRLDHNMSQQEMASLIHSSQSYYSQLESGTRKPGLQMVRRLADLLGVEPSFIRGLL